MEVGKINNQMAFFMAIRMNIHFRLRHDLLIF